MVYQIRSSGFNGVPILLSKDIQPRFDEARFDRGIGTIRPGNKGEKSLIIWICQHASAKAGTIQVGYLFNNA